MKGVKARSKEFQGEEEEEEPSIEMSEEIEANDPTLFSNELETEDDENSNTYSKTPNYRSSDTNGTISAKKCCVVPKEEIFNNVWIFDTIIKFVLFLTKNIYHNLICFLFINIYFAFRTTPGWMTWKTKVPNDSANWKLSTFTVDPNVGITIMQPTHFTIISSIKSMYLISKVPFKIKVGKSIK